jgi:hypothetical protein
MVIKHHHEGNIVQFRGRGTRAQLREALTEHAPVQIARERVSPGLVHGYVIGIASEYCLVAEVSEAMRFDGFIALAIGDISAVEQDPGRKFVERALQLNEQQLPQLADFKLDNWQAIAESAARETPLISLNMLDDELGEVSYVGRLTGTEPGALILQEVDPNANWYPDTGAYDYADIGSIGFATEYMLMLARIAGAPPVPLPPEAMPAS